MPECNVALCGCGTVGAGVAGILLGRRGMLADRLGPGVKLCYAVDLRIKDIARELDLPPSVKLTDNFEQALGDPKVHVVVELFGGLGAARALIDKALRAGKHVVTANKALLAAHGAELYRVARQNGRAIAFEASVAGGIPIIAAVRDSLVPERIESVYGIVNGTCNYILTQMTGRRIPYAEALAEAQQRGYAEADPTLDVEGHDSAHKLAVLSRLAFGVDVGQGDIYCEGISRIEPEDLEYAHALGYTVKLLAIGIRRGDALEMRVHPCLLRHGHSLAAIGGAFNAVCVHGDCVGELVFTGLGAGRWPTASAVVSDICRIALGAYQRDFAELPQFGDVPRVRAVPFDKAQMRYYFRLGCLDRPGVLAQVAGILGRHGISIASCIQQDRSPDEGGRVPVVFMSHEAREGAMADALREVNALDCIDGPRTRMLRVQEI